MSNDPVETFKLEASDLLEQLEQGLMDLEQDPQNPDLVNSVFRALHTIKGSGAMFGFTDVAEFVHLFETAFDRVRKGFAPVSDGLIAVGLKAKDHITGLIDAPDKFRPAGTELLEQLRLVVGEDGDEAQPSAPDVAVETKKPEPALEDVVWNIRFWLPVDALVHGKILHC
jgi:two-component system chemotaxis sensor kinase CheA